MGRRAVVCRRRIRRVRIGKVQRSSGVIVGFDGADRLLAPVVGAACCENGGSNRGNVSSSAMARIAAIVSGVRREFARQSREQRARRKDKEKYNKQGPGRGGF